MAQPHHLVEDSLAATNDAFHDLIMFVSEAQRLDADLSATQRANLVQAVHCLRDARTALEQF